MFILSLAWRPSSLPVGPVQTRVCKVWVGVWLEASSLLQRSLGWMPPILDKWTWPDQAGAGLTGSGSGFLC